MHRKSAYILFLAVLGLLALGIVILFSTGAFAKDAHNDVYYFLRRHAIWLGIGMVGCCITGLVDYHFWQKTWWIWFLFSLVGLALCFLPPLRHKINGSWRWLEFHGLTCQPSEFAKLAAVFRATLIDHLAMTTALAGISMPNFWLGPLLAILFAVRLGWLPVSGTGGLSHLILPAVTLGAALSAILARMTRASVLEELRELYVLAARARGVSGARAVVRHAFRNSLIPIVTIIGLQFGAVLTGTIITETIFAWPGIGRLLIQAINFRDYPLVQGCILFISITYVAMNLVTDLTYGLLDPRIRYD